MQRYILIRGVWAFVALWAVSILVFGLARITGDPTNTLLSFEATDEQREIMKAYWGLDKPLPEQYAVFIGNIFQGDLGDSFKWRQPVTTLVKDRFPNTIILAALAIAVASVIAIPMGVLSAVRRDSIFDSIGKSIALIGQSAPPFWFGVDAHVDFCRATGLGAHLGQGRSHVLHPAYSCLGAVLGGGPDAADPLGNAGRA